MSDPRTVVLALGGNALIRPGEEGTVQEQTLRAREVARLLAGFPPATRLAVTHGNGPQVGRILLRSDLCQDEVPGLPLDVAVAASQGEIGTMLQQALRSELQRPVVGLLSHVLVDLDDPAFQEPRKYVGRFYTQDEAKLRAMTLGWQVREDPGRGWRRVVPSPIPTEVLELDAVAVLLDLGCLVLTCGGGGIPVAQTPAGLVSVEAVVDKDRASALLARRLNADQLIILTGVDEVMVDFTSPSPRPLRRVRAAELRAHLEDGQFPPGSMGPKVEAVLEYLDQGHGSVLITSPECLVQALAGQRGTEVLP